MIPRALLLAALVALPPLAAADDLLACVSTICVRDYASLGCLPAVGVQGDPLTGSYGAGLCTVAEPGAVGGVAILLCGGQPSGDCNRIEVIPEGGVLCVEDFQSPSSQPAVLACAP